MGLFSWVIKKSIFLVVLESPGHRLRIKDDYCVNTKISYTSKVLGSNMSIKFMIISLDKID